MKKILFTSIVLSFFILACSKKKPASEAPIPELAVYTIQNSETTTISEYPASIRGLVDIEIRPQVGGILDKVFVDEGAFVSQGQLLFKINERPFREQLHMALGNLNAADAAVITTQLEIDKLSPLVQNKVVSDYQLKSAHAAHKIALSNLEQAKAMVENAKINLGYTNIHAPVNGYIGRLPKRQGSLLAPTDVESLTTLSDIQKVYVYFSLGEVDFIQFKNQYIGATLNEKIKNIAPVSLKLADKTVYEESGTIDVIDGQFDKNTGAIMLRATFPNPQNILRSGNTGKIQMKMNHTDALLIPQEATVEIQDKVFVFYVDTLNQVFKKPITTSGRSGNHYLVKDGLRNGDQIILKGFETLQEGTVIRPQTTSSQSAKPDVKI